MIADLGGRSVLMVRSPDGRAVYSRRRLLCRGVAAGAALVAPALAGTQAAASPATRVLAAVDMELVLLACQVDPPKSGTGTTPGAQEHVLAVEQALRAEGLLAAAQTDGHFGTATLDAYAAWQRSLGFDGIDANGISDPDMSRPARNQIHDYYFGRNGLANHAPDNTPEQYRVPLTWWEKYKRG
jgi:hypothetical protein